MKLTFKFQGFKFGGDNRDRTDDLLNAIQALSQLSYNPKGSDNITKNKLNFYLFLKKLKFYLLKNDINFSMIKK